MLAFKYIDSLFGFKNTIQLKEYINSAYKTKTELKIGKEFYAELTVPTERFPKAGLSDKVIK